MISPSQIFNRKRAAIAFLIIAAAIPTLIAIMKKSPPAGDAAEKSGDMIANPGETAAVPKPPGPAADHLASVAVIVLNNGNELPLGIKVDDEYIRIPGPSSWPTDNDGTAGSEKGRFLAGIIDTADVLKANGFNPDDAFSFVVGGTALNAANTFRVTGNHQADFAKNNADGYSEEYHTPPGEDGIWRSLKFKNIVLSYGQIPSLADFLASPQPNTATSAAAATQSQGGQNLSPTTDNTARSNLTATAHQYVEALGSADPAIRANAVRDLTLSGYQQDKGESDPSIRSLLERSLSDNDPGVRAAALNSLEMWNGSIPMQTLSNIALSDQIPELRMHALDVLVNRFGDQALPILQQASRDPDLRVGQKATQLMKQF